VQRLLARGLHLLQRGGGCLDISNYRFRVLRPLAEKLRIERLDFQMATQAQGWARSRTFRRTCGTPKPTPRPTNYAQALPESVRDMVGSVYQMLAKGEEAKKPTVFIQ
jgi:hypothetical protein